MGLDSEPSDRTAGHATDERLRLREAGTDTLQPALSLDGRTGRGARDGQSGSRSAIVAGDADPDPDALSGPPAPRSLSPAHELSDGARPLRRLEMARDGKRAGGGRTVAGGEHRQLHDRRGVGVDTCR